MNDVQVLSESYPATAHAVPAARGVLASFARRAGATEEQIDDVRLAVSEALTNIVKHAYRDGEGRMHVTAAVASGDLWILIADDGDGLHAHRGRPGLGMGLALMACLTESFTVLKRSSGGTELQMRFNLLAANSARRDHCRGERRSANAPA
jgi:serine/threonine-protein kinase RsbW